ncbi:hypothetical protein H5410_057585 [Solanum commersonii]|uniref:Uncharacterized protein n=1 Tax=Solanum commersonii TaxID=4109 RepID=A0A9J5WNA5_SOLCO|nr:hypothetical protein H5410_057585 [Solanum commersonii]
MIFLRKLDIQKRRTLEDIPEIGYFLNDRKTIQPKQSHGKLYLWDYIQHLINHKIFVILYQIGFKPVVIPRPTIKILPEPFHKLYKEWVKVSPDLNKLYHQEHICYFQQIEQIYFFIEFSVPWIHKGFLSRFYRGTNPLSIRNLL